MMSIASMHPNLIVVAILTLFLIGCKKDDTPPLPKYPVEVSNPNALTGAEHANQNVGASANELLSNAKYSKLIVEISYMEGFKPSQRTIDELTSFLRSRLNKSSIDIQLKPVAASAKDTYSVEQLAEEEKVHRALLTDDTTLTAHLMIVDGFYSANESVLGIAYRNTSMVLFGKAISKYSGGLSRPSKPLLESAVTLHEFGHILGLVNVGSAMQDEHQDEKNGKHCDNEDCLMYWAAESGDAFNALLGSGVVPSLDQNCLKDLKANGGL